jgi:mannose-6-phosphate isomerase-like protein (cupin superfamily)
MLALALPEMAGRGNSYEEARMSTDTDKDIIRAQEPADGVSEFHKPDPYAEWIKAEGVKLIEEFAFDDLNAVGLGPWERKGGKGAIVNIPYESLTNDTQLVEINPGGHSEPEHHMYEEYIYVLAGRGAASIWLDEKQKHTFEWKAGSLFTIPMNANYQLFNGSGTEPARYMAVTNAPVMMRQFMNNDFIWNNPFQFTDRFGNAEEAYNGSGKLYARRVWSSNFIPNVPDMPLYAWDRRGAGGINAMFEMAGNQTRAHVSEFPVGTYKKAHRHGPGANLMLLSGDAGYSLLWTKEDRSDMRKADWKVGSLVIVPADGTFHQHFNSGSRRARYLALTPGRFGFQAPFVGAPKGADTSFDDGGYQIEYTNEHPSILDMFEEECLKHGAAPNMRQFFPSRTDYKISLPK